MIERYTGRVLAVRINYQSGITETVHCVRVSLGKHISMILVHDRADPITPSPYLGGKFIESMFTAEVTSLIPVTRLLYADSAAIAEWDKKTPPRSLPDPPRRRGDI